MTLVVLALALVLFLLERNLITGDAVLFLVVLLIPSLVVDLLILFGPKPDVNSDPLGQYRTPQSARRRSR
jgi:hypothetical protein